MQSNSHRYHWLLQRGITPSVIDAFGIDPDYSHPTIGDCIKIPYSQAHSKYRRDPQDERKPKYLYDAGGKVTLYGANKLSHPTVVITEGELDTLVLWSQNIQAVSSTGGALSFQDEWVDLLATYNVFLCFDNDDAGVNGMIKVLKKIPTASVILIPELPGVKDISDYVARGGDFRELMQSALHDLTITSVREDMGRRKGLMLSTRFHEAYLDAMQQDLHKSSYDVSKYEGDDRILKAKSYPLHQLLDFQQRKMCCPWHQEKTPSLHYYPKTNSAYCFGRCGKVYDSIDAYQLKHNVSFKEAVEALNKLV